MSELLIPLLHRQKKERFMVIKIIQKRDTQQLKVVHRSLWMYPPVYYLHPKWRLPNRPPEWEMMWSSDLRVVVGPSLENEKWWTVILSVNGKSHIKNRSKCFWLSIGYSTQV
jgi:hypothetical protein